MRLGNRARRWATKPSELNLPRPIMAYAPYGMLVLIAVVMVIAWVSDDPAPVPQLEASPPPPPIPTFVSAATIVLESTGPTSSSTTGQSATVPATQPPIPDTRTSDSDARDVAWLAADAAYSGDCSEVVLLAGRVCPPQSTTLYYPEVRSLTLLSTSSDRRLYEVVYNTEGHPPRLLAVIFQEQIGWVWDPDIM